MLILLACDFVTLAADGVAAETECSGRCLGCNVMLTASSHVPGMFGGLTMISELALPVLWSTVQEPSQQQFFGHEMHASMHMLWHTKRLAKLWRDHCHTICLGITATSSICVGLS